MERSIQSESRAVRSADTHADTGCNAHAYAYRNAHTDHHSIYDGHSDTNDAAHVHRHAHSGTAISYTHYHPHLHRSDTAAS